MAHYDREANGVASRSPSRAARSRFYQETNNVQHDLRDSASLSSSNQSYGTETVYSDERFIVDAIRVTTPTDDSSTHQTHAALEDGLATNMAMFIPSGSSTESSPRRGRTIHRGNWRNGVFSDQSSPRLRPLGSSPLNEIVSVNGDSTSPHRKAVSLDAVSRDDSSPRWPGNAAPAVAIAHPPYPPPRRIPTPPGLPSFNTAAALQYSAQFLTPRNGARSSASSPVRGESPRTALYGEALRRFFRVTPSPERERPSSVGIGRADDGTIVQGRFPYRQSGHGTSLARQLEDHPFHRSNLPVAEIEGEITGGESTEHLAAKEPVSRPKRHARLFSPPTIGRLWPSTSPRLSPSQEPGAPAHLWRPLTSRGIFRLSRNSSLDDRQPRAPPASPASPRPDQAGPPIQETGLAERPPSSSHRPSRLQSTLAQNPDEATGDDEISTSRFSVRDAFFWLPIQMYICCCLGTLNPLDDAEDQDPLNIVSSRETYMTAHSRPSITRDQADQADHPNEDNPHGTRPGMQSWISSVYYSICSRAPDPAQSF